MAAGNTRDLRIYPHDIVDTSRRHGMHLPDTREGWQREYGRRYDAYLGHPYDEGEIRAMHLFRALDPDGDIIDQTRRLVRDYAYVCDTDASALYGEGWRLTTSREMSGGEARRWQEAGDLVWSRSRVGTHGKRWCTDFAILGDMFLRAVLTPRGMGAITTHDPRHVEVVYDSQGIEPEVVIVRIDTFSPDVLDDRSGEVRGAGTVSTYVQELRADKIRTWRDGRLVPEESGRNILGVIPVVHVPFIGIGEPGHSLGAAHGLDEVLSLVSSLLTQLSAIGNRYASPFYVARGINLTESPRLGRMINRAPADGGIDIVEPSMQGIATLLDAALRHHEMVRSTLPEFQLAEAAAGASGEALRVRAASFVGKMQPIRAALLESLATVTAMAWALESRTVWREADARRYVVEAGSIVPSSAGEELERVLRVYDAGLILTADVVEHLQRLGIVDPEADADVYAEAIEANAASRDKRVIDGIRGATQQPEQQEQEVPEDVATLDDVEPPR